MNRGDVYVLNEFPIVAVRINRVPLIYHKYINNCFDDQVSVVYDLMVTENHCT